MIGDRLMFNCINLIKKKYAELKEILYYKIHINAFVFGAYSCDIHITASFPFFSSHVLLTI